MSTKAQQGAAESRERDQVMDPRVGTGRFGRLRRLPGFRTAAVAFLLTVVLGLGGTAAYAYWSASTAATITVTPMPNVVKPPPPGCSAGLIWVPQVPGMDPDAVYVLTLTVGSVSKSYAVQQKQAAVAAAGLDPRVRLPLGATNGETRPMDVILRTAIAKKQISGSTPVEESDLAFPSEPVQGPKMSYTTKNSWLGPYAEFGCR